MPNKKSTDTRVRNWTFVLYPESAPENWRSILDDEHIQWIESPLHDKDLNNDEDRTPKKAHWHILLMYEGKKSYDQIKAITDRLNAPIPKKCANVKGLVRYFAHLDNPEKAQYSQSDIIGHGGADVASYFKASSSERYIIIRDMIAYVRKNNIFEFQDLMDYAAEERFDDWFPLLCDNSAYVVGQYIKSQRHRRETIFIDNETGELKE